MLDNPHPVVREVEPVFRRPTGSFDSGDIYNMISNIRDPEHPYTLEQLNVVSPELIEVDPDLRWVDIRFTPTVPHCSLSSMIGLSIRVKLMKYIPKVMKVKITVAKGTHAQEEELNKQLNDKERVSAALENPHLMEVINSNINEWE